MDLLAQSAFGHGQGRAPLTLRLRLDQVGEPFRFRQVDPSVLEGAAREFARLRQPKPVDAAQGVQDCPDNRPTAMAVELDEILSRRAGSAIKSKPQRGSSR
jgi:hypothetical protein